LSQLVIFRVIELEGQQGGRLCDESRAVMRASDAGRGRAKLAFTLLVLGAIGYAAVQIVPVYVDNYELEDFIQQQTPFWLVQQIPVEVVRDKILAKAKDLGLPVTPQQVKIEANASKYTVNIDYTVPIDLKVYSLPLHFSPASENRVP